VEIRYASRNKKIRLATGHRVAGCKRRSERQGVHQRSDSLRMFNNSIIELKEGFAFKVEKVTQAAKYPWIPDLHLQTSKISIDTKNAAEVQFGPWGKVRYMTKSQKVECRANAACEEPVSCLDILTILADEITNSTVD